jgi:hypothetical protein
MKPPVAKLVESPYSLLTITTRAGSINVGIKNYSSTIQVAEGISLPNTELDNAVVKLVEAALNFAKIGFDLDSFQFKIKKYDHHRPTP